MKCTVPDSWSLLRALVLVAFGAIGHAGETPLPTIVVTLLGTGGGPDPIMDRLGPSTLVEAGGQRLLFDAGRGVPIRLTQAGVKPGAVSAVFLTHLHSDHVVGLPDLMLTGWLPPFGRRSEPLRVFGPAGTNQLMRGLAVAFAEDVRLRRLGEAIPKVGTASTVVEFRKDELIYDVDRVEVTAFKVDHAEASPAFGFLITYKGRSVVISGDTKYSENLIRHSRGVDVLVHEVGMATALGMSTPQIQFVLGHHTTSPDAARVFKEAAPRLAVFSHLGLLQDPSGNRPSVGDLMAEMAPLYVGPLECGEDLMRIEIGDSIRITRPSTSGGPDSGCGATQPSK